MAGQLWWRRGGNCDEGVFDDKRTAAAEELKFFRAHESIVDVVQIAKQALSRPLGDSLFLSGRIRAEEF